MNKSKIREIRNRLVSQIYMSGVNKKWIAEQLKVKPSKLYYYLKYSSDIEFLDKIANAIGYEIELKLKKR